MAQICPETGKDLTGKDKLKHAFSVWGVAPEELNRLGPEAQRRYIQVLEMDAKSAARIPEVYKKK